MSSINTAIRLKRFSVRKDKTIQLVLEASSGKAYTFKILNASMTGLAALVQWSQEMSDDFNEDDIIPTSKIVADQKEVHLGRLVIKRVPQEVNDEDHLLGFSAVDTKIPLDGALSQYFEADFSRGDSVYDHELPSKQFNIASFVGVDFSNVDLLERTRKFGIFYRDWEKSEKFAYFQQRETSQGPRIQLTRPRSNGRNDYIMMGSNDYLGLASHPAVKEAAKKAIDDYGFGSTGTPATSGHSVLHEALCQKMAQLYKKEDAIIYASGYAANVGIISGLCREQDLIVADMLSHASIHDGINMSRAASRLFKHNDMGHLEKILEENRSQYSACLIATEGAFSMDGTIGELDEIYKLARKYNARIFIDQAHCLGVVGKNGLGTVEKYNLMPETDIIMGLFSRALGSVGGFVAGTKDMCSWLRALSRSYMFASSVPPSTAAATLKAIEIMQSEDLVAKLQSNVQHFLSGLKHLGAPFDVNHETAIIPVEIRNEEKMGKMYQSLLESGVFVMPIVYPVVSRNRCRFRFSVRADFSTADIDYVVAALERAMQVADFSFSQLSDEKKSK